MESEFLIWLNMVHFIQAQLEDLSPKHPKFQHMWPFAEDLPFYGHEQAIYLWITTYLDETKNQVVTES